MPLAISRWVGDVDRLQQTEAEHRAARQVESDRPIKVAGAALIVRAIRLRLASTAPVTAAV